MPDEPAGDSPWGALPEETRTEIEKTGYKGVEDLANGYLHSQRQLGVSIPIPSSEASDDDRAAFRDKLSSVEGVGLLPKDDDEEGTRAFYTKLGRPAEATGYELDTLPPEKVKDWLGDNASSEQFLEQQAVFQTGFRDAAHAANLTGAQVKALTTWYNSTQEEGIDAGLELRKAAQAEAEKHLGTGPKYEASRVQIETFVNKFLPSDELRAEVLSELERTGLGNVPALSVLLYQASVATLEDADLPRGGASADNTEFEIQQKLEAITANMDHAYYNRKDPQHDSAVRKVQAYHDQLRRLSGVSEFVAP